MKSITTELDIRLRPTKDLFSSWNYLRFQEIVLDPGEISWLPFPRNVYNVYSSTADGRIQIFRSIDAIDNVHPLEFYVLGKGLTEKEALLSMQANYSDKFQKFHVACYEAYHPPENEPRPPLWVFQWKRLAPTIVEGKDSFFAEAVFSWCAFFREKR